MILLAQEGVVVVVDTASVGRKRNTLHLILRSNKAIRRPCQEQTLHG